MKILWVKAGKLVPVDTGGKIRSYNILKGLMRTHDVTLLSYYRGSHDPAYESEVIQHFPGAISVAMPARDKTFWERTLDYAPRLLSATPYAISKFTSPEVRQAVENCLAEGQFDVAVCDFLTPSLNFPHHPSIPVVLFQHNVETAIWRRLASNESNVAKRLLYRLEAARMAHYERATLARFPHIVAVSEHDRRQMEGMNPACEITVVPTGVDTNKFRPAPSPSLAAPLIVFTGSMDWEPNVDAVEYFCREIWPLILAAYPDARFQIVGRDPQPRVRRLASASVEVTGSVPSVIEYLQAATVVIVPLRIGGGTRLKIFEAMAMGKAMVSTSIGAEGLEVQHGRDLMLADDPASFAASVIQLLREPELRRQYERSAVALASRYDWSRIAQSFADVLLQASQPRQKPSPAMLYSS